MSTPRMILAVVGLFAMLSSAWADEPALSKEERSKLVAEAQKLSQAAHQLGQQDKHFEAIPLAEQALAIRRKLYPKSEFADGHPGLAANLNMLGFSLSHIGEFARAQALLEEALTMRRTLYPKKTFPNGNSFLAYNLSNLGTHFIARGEFERARPYLEEALAMNRKLYPEKTHPDGHVELAGTLNNLGFLFRCQGDFAKALAYFEQALAMRRKLYREETHPNGHPNLANTLINLANLWLNQHAVAKAIPYLEEAYAMRQTLYPESQYPDGHADLANSLTSLGVAFLGQKDYVNARRYYEQAVAMCRRVYPEKKYPDGHPHLGLCLNNLGHLETVAGAYEKAVGHHEQALAMNRRLYPASTFPDGHPNLVLSLANLGHVFHAQGDLARALPFCRESVELRRRLGDRLLLQASEAEAFAYLTAQPLSRDSYMSLLRMLPNTDAELYEIVWQSKSAVGRVQALRREASRANNTKIEFQLSQLRALRLRTELTMQSTSLAKTDKLSKLTRLREETDALERELARSLPILALWQKHGAAAIKDLIAALPEKTAFVDFCYFLRFAQDPTRPGVDGESWTGHYLAFVLAPGRPVQCVDLGPALPINTGIQSWRQAIDARRDSSAPDTLRRLVWEPIAKRLPQGTTKLYLAPDESLARLPWPALPVGRERILLEDFALATVPHGLFVLEQLKAPQKPYDSDSVLLVGGVNYGKAKWHSLPASATEIDVIAKLAKGPVRTLDKDEATATNLLASFPTARFAHFATHGEFKAKQVARERAMANQIWQDARGSALPDFRMPPAANPLGYVGLVLSQGEVMSGISIVDLPLENLKLVALSACETGLGELVAGEGVFGFARAFHLAGCPNVVASLWKVNDTATAALMAKFYHELWVNRKPPIEALREAQLTIYHHPELIPDLAGERGAPKLKEAVTVKTTGTSPVARQKTADTKLWAAFVLSGVGK